MDETADSETKPSHIRNIVPEILNFEAWMLSDVNLSFSPKDKQKRRAFINKLKYISLH